MSRTHSVYLSPEPLAGYVDGGFRNDPKTLVRERFDVPVDGSWVRRMEKLLRRFRRDLPGDGPAFWVVGFATKIQIVEFGLHATLNSVDVGLSGLARKAQLEFHGAPVFVDVSVPWYARAYPSERWLGREVVYEDRGE